MTAAAAYNLKSQRCGDEVKKKKKRIGRIVVLLPDMKVVFRLLSIMSACPQVCCLAGKGKK